MALLTQPPLNQRFHLSLEFIGSSTLNDSMATLLGRKLIEDEFHFGHFQFNLNL